MLSCIAFVFCVAVMAWVCAWDIRARLIPNAAVAALLVLRLVLLAASELVGLQAELFGAGAFLRSGIAATVVLTLLLLCAHTLQRRNAQPIGGGDIKLFAACFLYLNLDQLFLMLFATSIAGLITAAVYWLRQHDPTFPFAPAIAIGFLVALVA